MYPGEVVLKGLAAVGGKALPDVVRKLEAGRLKLRDAGILRPVLAVNHIPSSYLIGSAKSGSSTSESPLRL